MPTMLVYSGLAVAMLSERSVPRRERRYPLAHRDWSQQRERCCRRVVVAVTVAVTTATVAAAAVATAAAAAAATAIAPRRCCALHTD